MKPNYEGVFLGEAFSLEVAQDMPIGPVRRIGHRHADGGEDIRPFD